MPATESEKKAIQALDDLVNLSDSPLRLGHVLIKLILLSGFGFLGTTLPKPNLYEMISIISTCLFIYELITPDLSDIQCRKAVRILKSFGYQGPATADSAGITLVGGSRKIVRKTPEASAIVDKINSYF